MQDPTAVRTLWVMALFVGAVAAVLVSTAVAARQPTHQEREAIVRALPASIRNTPVECLRLVVRISRNPRYSYVGREYLNAIKPGSRCTRYAGDGFYILKKAPGWKIIYTGSDPPPCSKRIPRDLGPCLKR